MRTSTISLAGRDYLLCFSVRVARNCAERYGNLEKIADAVTGEDTAAALDETIWLLAQLLSAGSRYAEKEGIDNPPPLAEDDLWDLCGIGDLAELKDKIFETVNGGEVEITPKKEKTTQRKPES